MNTSMKTTLRDIENALRFLLKDIDRRYRLRRTSPVLMSSLREFVLRPGKRVRPYLFMLAYTGLTPRRTFSRARLARAAASIELLHDFMLIHDDVIDASDLRRGKPTLHRVFDRNVRPEDGARLGTELAIVAGDILYAVAIEALLEIDEAPARKVAALKELASAAASTGAGEFIDVIFGHRAIDRIREADILYTYTQKTARYTFSGPLVMGALLAGAPASRTKMFHDLGIAAGQAFQIYDDFLDLFGSKKLIGKPVLTDLAESKKTLLVHRAYRKLRGPRRRRLKTLLEKPRKTTTDLREFKALIVASGSVRSCLATMTRLQQKARSLVPRLGLRRFEREALAGLIEKLSPSRMPIQLNQIT